MNTNTRYSKRIKAVQRLFFVNAAIWLLFGVISLARMANQTTQFTAALVIGVLMLGNVAAMLIAGVGVGQQKRWATAFGLAVLLINIILTITDEFGIFDLITLLLDGWLLALLIATRRHETA